MRIFIPTRGRVDRQLTLQNAFLQDMPWRTTFIVPEREAYLWRERDFVALPDEMKIAETRQFILDEFSEDPFHIVIDDDLRFSRRYPGTRKLHPSSPDDIRDMFQWIETQLTDGWVHGGISPRQFNDKHPDIVQNTRIIRFHFYNRDFVVPTGVRFDAIREKEDFHFTLTLLENGYPNIQSCEFAQDQNGTNLAGGCSEYRNKKSCLETSQRLAELHPGVVSIRLKETLTGWDGIGERADVHVSWKKALKI